MSVILILLLFVFKSQKGIPQKILMVILIISFFFIIQSYAYVNQINWLGTIGMLFSYGYGYIFGPLIYFYIQSILNLERFLLKNLFRHLIPYFIVWVIFVLPFAINNLYKDFSKLDEFYGFSAIKVYAFFYVINHIYFSIYFIISLRLISKMRKANRDFYSSNINNLEWLKKLLIGIEIVVILDLIFAFLSCFYNPLIQVRLEFVIFLQTLLIILFCFLSYRGIFQSRIFLPTIISDSYSQTEKAQISIFNFEEITRMKAEIECLMKDKMLYKNPNLSLRDVAIELEISNQKLTNFINQNLKTNFQSLINSYRIKEFKNRIEKRDSEKYTLLSIAIDCGFNSKSSFNRIFKQLEGCTPTQYLKSLNS
ncbi:helix-turn-helix domain-containing protein [Yeosuana marina]|uniref:helix-turn-helix domain-containing protein n=1 Tax=Yeosuana marina TaxID=1565536 RepID=UPI00141FEF94|nr:AraC family transcriptional regulator [Yeosuana marina]